MQYRTDLTCSIALNRKGAATRMERIRNETEKEKEILEEELNCIKVDNHVQMARCVVSRTEGIGS